MKILSAIPKAIWKLLFLTNFLVGLVVLYPFFRILLFNKKWFPICFKLMRFWAHWILWVPGIWVKPSGLTHLTKIKGPVVFCANHTSYIDIVVSYYIFEKYFVFMGKAELDKIPLFRVFFERMNILVERKSRVGSHKAFVEAAARVERGESVFLFPEGTINKQVPTILPFKNGAFKLAIDKQVPVVPVTFLNNWKMLQNGGFFKSNGNPGIAKVIIHEPISTQGLKEEDLVSLKNQVYTIINQPLAKKP